MDELHEKFENLKSALKSYGKCAVAFSGGVDSTFLLCVAHEVLGQNCTALTANLCSVTETDLNFAKNFCISRKINHINLKIDEFSIPEFKDNPVNRCYFCKKTIFQNFISTANEQNLGTVIEGSNVDDQKDYRPGRKALDELQVASPLNDAHLSKQDIRLLSKELGLETWKKDSAACLSSRIPYGQTITKEKLRSIEKAEDILVKLGYHNVRVRLHEDGKLARIEVAPEEIGKLASEKEQFFEALKECGFLYVTLDLAGYKTGSLNAMEKL
ncbi:MAG: ATP-dependent sacrificial sulfur transferase LarE [Treponemataceae bacterium]|nr:ATP-dependent sacrificial sulfur transferase LarE [Treponemataceae bacterium]